MGKVVKSITKIITDIADAVIDVAIKVWKELTVPLLEDIFAIFGIEDETVVTVNKVSIAVLEEQAAGYKKAAFSRTVLGLKNDKGFYSNYIEQFYKTKAEVKRYYRYAEKGPYIHGLPDMEVSGTVVDYNAIDSALGIELSGSYTTVRANAAYPSPEVWFKYQLQSAPYNYIPYLDTLTFTDSQGSTYNDWGFGDAVFNTVSMDFDVSINRIAEIYNFSVSSPAYVKEGETGIFTISCQRNVAAGADVTAALSYSGVPSGEFTAPSTVTILAGTSSVNVEISGVAPAALRRLTVDFSISNKGNCEHVAYTLAKKRTTIALVPSGVPSIVLRYTPVQEGVSTNGRAYLVNSHTSAFSVNVTSSDSGSAVAGTDYVPVSTTLNFNGSDGQFVNFSVSADADVLDEDYEEFILNLSSSDPGVDDSFVGIVRITDDSVTPASVTSGVVTEVLSFPNYSVERYMVAEYHSNSAPESEWYYWLYRLQDNTYPSIDPNASQISNLDMLPVAIIRQNKQFIDQDYDPGQDFNEDFGKHTQIYKSTRNILRMLGLKLEDVIAAVGDNPDIDSVDDAFVNFGMSPKSSNNTMLSKLLWFHWYEIIVVQGIESNNNKYMSTFAEQDVNNAMAWSHHSYQENVNPIGIHPQLNYQHGLIKVGQFAHTVANDHLYIIEKTEDHRGNLITVENLAGMAAVAYDGYHNVAYTKVAEDNFTMPVSWFVLNKLRAPEILEVYPYIFRLDMYSIDVTEIAWYKTSAFKVVFQIIMIIVTIYTGYAQGLTLAQVLFNVAVNLALSYIVIEIAIFVAKVTGNEYIAAVVAVVAMAYLGGGNYDWNTIDGLSNIVTTFSQGLSAAKNEELKSLQQDLNELVDAYEAQQDLLREQDGNHTKDAGIAEILLNASPDTQLYLGRDVQFGFELLYDYDNLLSNYFDSKLNVGPA